jgi:hypothetical protein
MVFCIAEIRCAPGSQGPIPTTIKIVKVFGTVSEMLASFPKDLFHSDPDFKGQDVYQVMWDTDEALNLDRSIVRDNKISNTAMWLPESKKIYGETNTIACTPDAAKRSKQKVLAAKRAGMLDPPPGPAQPAAPVDRIREDEIVTEEDGIKIVYRTRHEATYF